MKMQQCGFTIIELMLVIGIIAVLAALALPIYMDYSLRAKVTELVLAADGLKLSITEKAQADRSLANSGVGLNVVASGKVSGGSVSNGGVINIQGDAATIGKAITVTWTPGMTTEGRILWTCSTTATSFHYVPPECRN